MKLNGKIASFFFYRDTNIQIYWLNKTANNWISSIGLYTKNKQRNWNS